MFKRKNKKEEVFNPRGPKRCPICGKIFESWGNNSQPISSGLCCDECNYKYVIPVRRFLAMEDEYLFIPIDFTDKPFRFNYVDVDLGKIYLICEHLGINKEKLIIYNYKDLIFYYSKERNNNINQIATLIGNKIIRGNVIIEKKGEINV